MMRPGCGPTRSPNGDARGRVCADGDHRRETVAAQDATLGDLVRGDLETDYYSLDLTRIQFLALSR